MAGARGLLRAVVAFAVAAAMLAAAAAPVVAERVTSKEVIDAYSKATDRLPQDPQEALRELREALSGDLSPDERAILLRLAAQLEVELGNFRQAIRDIEASMATGVLDEVEMAESHYFLGRLYLGVEPPDYRKSIENLRKYLEIADDPNPDAYFYIGQAQALQGKYEQAIPHAKKAIELSKKPQENHYRLLLFCFRELDRHEDEVALLEHMIELFPDKDEYAEMLEKVRSGRTPSGQ